jgi:hypothetical protein
LSVIVYPPGEYSVICLLLSFYTPLGIQLHLYVSVYAPRGIKLHLSVIVHTFRGI